MNYMGVDIGTSGCKAAVFNKDGKQLAMSYCEYNVIFPENGGVELDSDEVIAKCFEVIKECATQTEFDTIKALSISSQGEAFTAIDKNGKTLCNAMVSSDKRALPLVKKSVEKIGEDKLYRITGHTAHPMFTLFKLLWLKENKPDVWNKSNKFLCFEDLLQYRLGLDPAISWSLAGRTMMFDVIRHEWSKDILDLLEMDKSKLAKPLQSGSVAGIIQPEIAKELVLAEGAFVVSGGHDQICNALGAGAVVPGKAIYAIGTVDCITPCFEKPFFSSELKNNNLCTYDHAVSDKSATVAYSLTGGNILKWFRDEFGEEEKRIAKEAGKDTYEILLKQMWNKPSSLMVFPYFTPSGTPYFDTETKGAIFGLRLSTQRGEFIRALLEGVAFEMRLNLEILEKSGYNIDELLAVGGGAKSAIWIQLKADVMNKKITTLNVTEAGCCGAAMLACATDNKAPINELANKWIKPISTVYPQLKNKEWYDKRFRLYRKLYKTVRNISL